MEMLALLINLSPLLLQNCMSLLITDKMKENKVCGLANDDNAGKKQSLS